MNKEETSRIKSTPMSRVDGWLINPVKIQLKVNYRKQGSNKVIRKLMRTEVFHWTNFLCQFCFPNFNFNRHISTLFSNWKLGKLGPWLSSIHRRYTLGKKNSDFSVASASVMIKVQPLTRRCPGPRSRWRGVAGSAWARRRWSPRPGRCRSGPRLHSSCPPVRTTSTVCKQKPQTAATQTPKPSRFIWAAESLPVKLSAVSVGAGHGSRWPLPAAAAFIFSRAIL